MRRSENRSETHDARALPPKSRDGLSPKKRAIYLRLEALVSDLRLAIEDPDAPVDTKARLRDLLKRCSSLAGPVAM